MLTFVGSCPTLRAAAIEAEIPDSVTVAATTEPNLSLPDVEVTARRTTHSGTTGYVMDRTVLDHAQLLNLSDIQTLLPGGQTVNSTLIDDSRQALRAGTSEQGNASFGTAVELDGVRLDNNAGTDETAGASTRNISTANIGKVEVIAGIPGVEYGDVSNGIIKVTPRRGRSPWIIEGSVNPYTRQIALNKGFGLRGEGGTINVGIEHARSFSDIDSPHTSYSRNNLSVAYTGSFSTDYHTLTVSAGVTGNLGGYSSKADPDAFRDTYTKVRDNMIQGNLSLNWNYNGTGGNWQTRLQGAVSYSDRNSESYVNTSSASTQPYIHTMTPGYAISRDYDETTGIGDIILGPTGYWYVKSHNDQKPLSIQLKIKTSWSRRFGTIHNRLTVGADYTRSSNGGRGVWYDDMSLAPTWRPYDYSKLPALNTVAAYIEERLTWQRLILTAGIRNDNSIIRGSDYGTVATFSPRVNALFTVTNREKFGMKLHAGYGKGVKLPSFQVLYPADSYSDRLSFTPGSTADNRAYYAYYTHVSKALYNPNLKWQFTNQVDIGTEITLFSRVKINLSAYYNRTLHPYQQVNEYRPFAYNYTSQSALEQIDIPSSERNYSVDPATGIVTVTSTADGHSIALPSTTRHTYVANRRFINGSPVTRRGLEWVVESPLTSSKSPLGLTLRLDGNYYNYKGNNQTLIAGTPTGIGDVTAGEPTPLIGYYRGSNVTSAGTVSTPSICNGSLTKGCSLNTTLTARIPKIRLIMTLRLEATFLNYKKNFSTGGNTYALQNAGDIFGTPSEGASDCYNAVYPEYYSTWEEPDVRIPFAEALAAAQNNDPQLFDQLCKLIVRSNTSYYFNPQDISAYFCANFSVTKEIGKHVSISFYANNFFNNMSFVRNAQTGLDTSLFGSTYIPKFYYGLSLRIKI